MSSSKSLPSSFKQNKRPIFHNNSTISRVTIEGGSHSSSSNSSDQIQSAYKDIYSSSFSSSNVKISSPLTKPAWIQHEGGDVTVNTDSSGTTSDKSWMTRRWSTVSGSLIARRKNKKTTASRLWTNRQKRRTFPPSTDILKRERKKFALPPAVPPINKKHHRQSLQDILTTFYKYNNITSNSSSSGGGGGGGMDGNESESTPTTASSSSMSKRLGRILKKRGKQPYNNNRKFKKPMLTINTHAKYTEDELKAAMMSMFQPPATISSKSSTPSSPLRFPTPPKRFSAYYVDSQGKSGKVNYKHKMALSHYILQFVQHGVFSSHTPPPLSDPVPPHLEKGHYQAYNRQLLLNTSLFLFGFLFFPCWWVGAWLYHKRQSRSLAADGTVAEDAFYEHDLLSIRTIAYLNTVFSCLSFVLVAIVLSLVIWLVKS